MYRTEKDQLYVTLGHLRKARKALLRTDWTNDRDKAVADLDRAYTRVWKAAQAAA